MMALAGIPLGLNFHFLDPSAHACASPLGKLHRAEFSDLLAVQAMASEIDVATFDFENVPADSARSLASARTFHPCVNALEGCQDRLLEKRLLRSLAIPVAEFQPVSSRTGLLDAVEKIGLPAVLKTRRLGYDGKGQVLLSQHEDLEPAWQTLGQSDLILEAFVPFTAECSLIAVRNGPGEVRFWPLTKNVHGNGVHIDNLETREERRVIPGICFSIEPGIYLEDRMAVRTEVDVFITLKGEVVVAGEEQENLILL